MIGPVPRSLICQSHYPGHFVLPPVNFLAHLYLADGAADSRVGAVLGDFLKGVALEELPAEVRAGVRLHLRVDVFTDAHPVAALSRSRIRPPHGRYAGVLVDLFYDHFLACRWEEYSPTPLPVFAAEVYSQMEASLPGLPTGMRPAVERMIEADWLCSYRTVDGIARALTRMERRLRRPHPLGAGAGELHASYEALEEDFHRFFPDLRVWVRRWAEG